MYLTTRPSRRCVSGQAGTIDNYYELFKCVLNPKQLDGLRLLVTPFPQQQFNAIDDRRSERPSLGVACLDCHVNGHSNAATHLVGDIRPQEIRHRIDTPSLRGTFAHASSARTSLSTSKTSPSSSTRCLLRWDPVLATRRWL